MKIKLKGEKGIKRKKESLRWGNKERKCGIKRRKLDKRGIKKGQLKMNRESVSSVYVVGSPRETRSILA